MEPSSYQSPDSGTSIIVGTDGPRAQVPNKGKLLIIIAAVVLVIVAVVAVVLAMRHHGDNNDTSLVAINNKVANVTIDVNGLTPKSITIKKGQETTWTNTDVTPRHLTADQTMLPSFDTAEPLQQGDTYTYIFDKTGTFHYYDATDPTKFVGTITVK